jgi:2,4-dienoyl-CoA reductase-like NADH-dependent reductase (Old Yellow Enzyme family)
MTLSSAAPCAARKTEWEHNMTTYRRIATLKTPSAFAEYLAALGVDLPFDAQVQTGADAPLAQPYRLPAGSIIGNRWAILPMEGWDGTSDGRPSELTIRRWRRFGASGAKLIWGGEAVAVRHDGRANPNQLLVNEANLGALAALRQALVAEHEAQWPSSDLLIGLQLTHSGRFARPNGKTLEPAILYHHPWLDRKFGVPADYPLMSDDEIARLVDDFAAAGRLAQRAGFAFVDVKHCHGYLGHEFLSAVDRPGCYGGSFENRTRFLRETVAAIRAAAPGLLIGVRLSAFDFVPFRPGPEGVGMPDWPDGGAAAIPSMKLSASILRLRSGQKPPELRSGCWSGGEETTSFDGGRNEGGRKARPYPYAFGGDGTGLGIDLAEPRAFLDLLAELGIPLVCITGGSPYYNPHIQRPALFPPSDGYEPPEDPLIGCARQVAVTAQLKAHRPDLLILGSALSYLQEWLPNVGQAVVRRGMTDFVGLGRMALSYPDMIADVLAGRPLQRKRICRTFSDCTTAPRKGLVSGCYPLDDYYRGRPEAALLVRMTSSAARQSAL